MAVKVWIDQDKCEGHGNCVKAVPQVFKIVDGKAYVVENGKVVGDGGPAALATVPAELEEQALDAVNQCPSEAIYVEVE